MNTDTRHLEIFLITYNRQKYLKNTFEQIFAENSPIKYFPITILNNKSTDGTYDLIEEYREKFPNIKHIVHNRNIGGNGNIARAFELASKKYVWVLCDDDKFNFTHWDKVEEAMDEDYDAILVANYLDPKKNIAQLIAQMTFVPSTIYKTEVFTDTVTVNMQYQISNMFPQLAPALKLINDNKRIKIMDDWIVKMVPNCGEESYVRGLDSDKHEFMAKMYWSVGFLNSLPMLKDKKSRYFIIDNLVMDGMKFLDPKLIIGLNIKFYDNFGKNFLDAYYGLNNKKRIKLCYLFLLAMIARAIGGGGVEGCFQRNRRKISAAIYNFPSKILSFYKTEKGLYVHLFSCLKFRILKNKTAK